MSRRSFGLLLLFAWVQNAEIYAVAWVGSRSSVAGGLDHAVRDVTGSSRYLHHRPCQCDPADLVSRDMDGRRAVFDGGKPVPIRSRRGRRVWLCGLPIAIVEQRSRSAPCSAPGSSRPISGCGVRILGGRAEPLVSRLPATFMLFAHGALFLLRTPACDAAPWSRPVRCRSVC